MKTAPKYIVVDLDGTLANIEHRLHFVQQKKKQFEKFYAATYQDSMNKWCYELIMAANNSGIRVFIVSARPNRLFLTTAQWLVQRGIPQGHIELVLLRGEKDFTPDHELKRNWLRGNPKIKQHILFVVDDRQRVVDMWREEGLVCLQAYAWEEFNAREN